MRKRRVACHTPTLAASGATLCAATNGTPSTDNTTSRTHTGARGATPSARAFVGATARDGFARDAHRDRAERAQMRGQRTAAGQPVFLGGAEAGQGRDAPVRVGGIETDRHGSDYNGATVGRLPGRTRLFAAIQLHRRIGAETLNQVADFGQVRFSRSATRDKTFVL